VIVVKHKYIPGRGPRSGGVVVAIGKSLAHMKYIQHRPGPDREKGGRELFNEADNVDAKVMRKEIKRLGGSRVVIHKLTLSPEINVGDKKEFTRQVMADLSRDKGLDLVWFGTEHNNTDHHHIHVVILGKDRNGTEVRIDLKDIDKAKEYGDRYLEKWHPRELERSRREREDRERERRQERDKAREAAQPGRSQLPWMNRNITREQIEPYREWSKKKAERQKEPERTGEDEKPYHQDTIEAAGKQWSRSNNLRDLQDLNDYLWDNVDERIPKQDYRKLKEWIKQKEKLRDEVNDQKPSQEKEKEQLKQEPGDQKPSQEKSKDKLRDEPESKKATKEKEKEPLKQQPDNKKKTQEKEKEKGDQIEYQSEKFKENDSYAKLTGLLKKTREDEQRLSFDDYQKLRTWIDDADRARFSGALDQELERVHKRDRTRTPEQLKSMVGGKVLEPAQEDLMSSPVAGPIIGVFLKVASVSKEIVRSIPLDDRLRDPLKEGRDELEAGKKGIDEREAERSKIPTSNMTPEELRGLRQGEKKDRDNRERIESDIEGNKKAKARELKKQKEDRDKADREIPYDTFDPWGRY
jgi:hypothetical protein